MSRKERAADPSPNALSPELVPSERQSCPLLPLVSPPGASRPCFALFWACLWFLGQAQEQQHGLHPHMLH